MANMSELRKSVSFRSRIPISAHRLKRQINGNYNPSNEHDSDCQQQLAYELKPNRSFDLKTTEIAKPGRQQIIEGSTVLTSGQPAKNFNRDHLHHSSYSSSDESHEDSDISFQVANKYAELPNTENVMCVSTDAISLDGLLDTVSCGSSNFSDPPSPVQYQNVPAALAIRNASYETLDDYKSTYSKHYRNTNMQINSEQQQQRRRRQRQRQHQHQHQHQHQQQHQQQHQLHYPLQPLHIEKASSKSAMSCEVLPQACEEHSYVNSCEFGTESRGKQFKRANKWPSMMNKLSSNVVQQSNSKIRHHNQTSQPSQSNQQQQTGIFTAGRWMGQTLSLPRSGASTSTNSTLLGSKQNETNSHRHSPHSPHPPHSPYQVVLEGFYNEPNDSINRLENRTPTKMYENVRKVVDSSSENCKLINKTTPPYFSPPAYAAFPSSPNPMQATKQISTYTTADSCEKVNVKQLKELYQNQQRLQHLPQTSSEASITKTINSVNSNRFDSRRGNPTHQQMPHTRHETKTTTTQTTSKPPIITTTSAIATNTSIMNSSLQKSQMLLLQEQKTEETFHYNSPTSSTLNSDQLLPTYSNQTKIIHNSMEQLNISASGDKQKNQLLQQEQSDQLNEDSTETNSRAITKIANQLEQQQLETKSYSDFPIGKSKQIQLKLKQNPLTRQLFGVIQEEVLQPRITPYRHDCELSGSYASLECPSPPGPPLAISEVQRDPQARLSNFLKSFYQSHAFKETTPPSWALPVPLGTLSPARLEPDLRLHIQSHGVSDYVSVDQLLISIQTKDGIFLEAPRRCLIECPTWISRNNICLRILHAWTKEPLWPCKGTPVAMAVLIPLMELKRNFAHYIEKEILPKGSLNPFNNVSGGFCAAWNSMEALGPKLLIVLDGYISQRSANPIANNLSPPRKYRSGGFSNTCGNKGQYPSDVYELLDGKLFPEARVIILTNSANCTELLPIIQRHIKCDGLTWGRSASILGGGRWGGPSCLVDAVQENKHLRQAARTPLGCVAISSIFEVSDGQLPTEELDVVESIFNCVAPNALTANVSELGRLTLFCLKMKRTYITASEIKMYCSNPEAIMGCMEKNSLFGKTAIKKGEFVYNPICSDMLEYLAANYIASLASRPGLLSAEITGMAIGDELDADLLKVLKFAMVLLNDQAYILLSKLTPLWLTPQTVFSLALAGGQSDSNMAALCDILGISKHPPISPLETKPLWVQVRSVLTDLMGWGMALKSPTCTLKNLEVIYQLEKQNLIETRRAIEVFLDAIAVNESVSTLRLSSLIEMDVKDSEINYLANCISKLLLKPRLENFELVLTLIEEDPPILKLQSVVTSICRTIPHQTKLNSLLLDLGLCTSQIVLICSALEKCSGLTRLSLPHLRCERGAISALSSLLSTKPISFLLLPSCWGARDDPPSSSGVSMGSGSGSSTGTSCLIKQGSLPGAPSPRSYAPGVFSSLPRGMFVPQTFLGRSATLPRQPVEQTSDKRSCDSVVSKTWYPTPCCDGDPHNSGTFHDLFATIRESYSKLHGLDLSKAQLSLEDSMCLGETVRVSNTLHTLKLEGSSRICEILPSILGASESPCLQMLSIGSQRLNLDDTVVVMCARALTSCSTLRLLSLDGWSLRIEHMQTLSIIRAFLSLTSIRELSLANCRVQTGLIKADDTVGQLFECRSIVVLKLAGAQVTLTDLTVFRGPQLMQFIYGFPCLRELDLSAPARSGIETTHTSPLILDDKCIIQFFQKLHTHFGLLNTLKICNWVIHFDEMSKSLKTLSKAVRNSSISHLKLDGISVLDRPKKKRCEAAFMHTFIANLPHLRWMGISLSGKKEEHISDMGNAVLDLKGAEIEIKLSESTIDQAKLMAQVISVDGKFDIKVSTFGTSSGILIHAERCGIKSLTRKSRDKDNS